MDAKAVYRKLEADFIKPGLKDDWAQNMGEIKEFLSANFKKRSMGLVCDNSKEIKQVYGAVFPSQKVMSELIDHNVYDALLFVHHPSIWDIRRKDGVFYQMDKEQLREFRTRRISIYNLHAPLDNFSEYSTSNCLAEELGIKVEKAFCPYNGGLAGVVGKTKARTVDELAKIFRKAIGHKVSTYKYGNAEIKDGRVAVVAGGGHGMDTLPDVVKEKVNVLVSGITALNDYSKESHEFDREHGLNVLGGTHYSTEKFACMKMCDYFKKIGLPSKFIADEPVMEDM